MTDQERQEMERALAATRIVCPECGDWDDIVETADDVYHCICGCEFGPAIDTARECEFQRSMDAMCDEIVARLHRMIDEEAAKIEAE